MVSTRRSRSAGGDSDALTSVHASQDEVSSGKGKQQAALQPINEEPAAAAAAAAVESPTGSEQPKQPRRRRAQSKQQQHVEADQQQHGHLQQQEQHMDPQQAAAQQQHDNMQVPGGQQDADTSSDVNDDGDAELEFDGPDVLQNLAAAIRSGFQNQSQQQQQQQWQRHQPKGLHLQAAAAAARSSSSRQEPDDTDLQQLRWRPHTGLQLPAGAAAAVALTRPRQKKRSQQRDEPLGALVDTPAAAAPAAGNIQQQSQPGAAAAGLPADATKQPGLSKALHAPTLDAAVRGKEAKKSAPDTAGSKWYDLPAPKMTDELKRDLRLLRLRGAFDPKRFYKSFDNTKFPKYFAIGTVVDDPLDNNRLGKGQRRSTLTEQLLADSELTHTRKRRFNKLQEEAQKWTKHKKRKTSQPRKQPAKHRPKH